MIPGSAPQTAAPPFHFHPRAPEDSNLIVRIFSPAHTPCLPDALPSPEPAGDYVLKPKPYWIMLSAAHPCGATSNNTANIHIFSHLSIVKRQILWIFNDYPQNPPQKRLITNENDNFWKCCLRKMIFSGFILSSMKRHRKRAARDTKTPKRPDASCRTSFSGHKGNKIPQHQKREKCPKFRLSQPGTYKPSSKTWKSQIRAVLPQKRQISHLLNPYMYAKNTFQAKKTPQNTAKQTRGVIKVTPQQPVRHLDGGRICINLKPTQRYP